MSKETKDKCVAVAQAVAALDESDQNALSLIALGMSLKAETIKNKEKE